MRVGDKQLGAPQILYKNTKSAIQAMTVESGAIAYATDTNELGYYNGTSWKWTKYDTVENADKLDGHHGSYYLNASNINAGTLSTDRYSAYADLVAESKIGTGSSQVAAGNHTHSSLDPITASLIPNVSGAIDLGSSTKLWRKGWLSELDAILFAQNTVTLLGGWLLITKDEGAIAADVGTTDMQIDFGKTMTPGDFVLFRAAGKVEYMQIGSLVSGTTYNVTRNLDGSGADAWPAGTPYAVLGQAGQGRIELNAFDTPRLQMIRQGATYNAQTELIRIGDLNGNWGYTSQKWGVAIGEYASGKSNITIDQDGNMKFNIYTTTVMSFSGGNADITGKLRMPGTGSAIAIGATPPTGSASGTGIWIDRTGLYSLASSVRQVWIDAATGRLYAGGGNLILAASGLSFTDSSSPTSERAIKWGTRAKIEGWTSSDSGHLSISAGGNFQTEGGYITIRALENSTPKCQITVYADAISQSIQLTAPNRSLSLDADGITLESSTYIIFNGTKRVLKSSQYYTAYLYVPKTEGEASASGWNGESKSTGTYTLYASDFGLPNTASALAVRIAAYWSSANNSYDARICDMGGNPYASARSLVANIYNVGSGVVPLDSSGRFTVVIAGAEASSVVVRVQGYFI